MFETNKAYLMNCMRIPALQSVLLYARAIDTNSDCTRLICDEWLELRFLEAETAQKILSNVLTLRTSFEKLFRLRLQNRLRKYNRLEQDSNNDDSLEVSRESGVEMGAGKERAKCLENLLKKKLAEFADSSVLYSIRRVMPAELSTTYIKAFEKSGQNEEENKEVLKKLSITGEETIEPKENETKGGFRITEYITYNW